MRDKEALGSPLLCRPRRPHAHTHARSRRRRSRLGARPNEAEGGVAARTIGPAALPPSLGRPHTRRGSPQCGIGALVLSRQSLDNDASIGIPYHDD